MIVEWLMYSLLIGVLLTAAARLLEHGLRGVGRPTRWAWLGASIATVVTPLLLLFRPENAPSAPLAVIAPLPPLEFLTIGGEAGPALPSLRAMLLAGWALSSLVVLTIGALAAWRLAQRRHGWETREVDGVEVLVSHRTGPAVVGVRRFEIVIPEWALSLSEAERAYMLRHEEEHARAGDPRVLLAGALLGAAAPWNLLVWYQLRRLVVAIEIDCDRRVLARGGDATSYAALLLDFGQRLSHTMLPAAAFAEPHSILETRIRHMTARKPRRGLARLVGAATAAVAIVTIAAAMPAPHDASSQDENLLKSLATSIDRMVAPSFDGNANQRATTDPAGLPVVNTPAMQTDTPPAQAIGAAPVFTPYTVGPKLLNAALVAQTLQVLYPAELRDAGIGGSVDMWFFIDEIGRVQNAQLKKSSGNETLDAAALVLAQTMEFSPALNRDQPVKVWVAMPVVFRPDAESAAAGGAATSAGRTPASGPTSASRPANATTQGSAAAGSSASTRATRQVPALERDPSSRVSPGDVLPQKITKEPALVNQADVAAALLRLYPPLLRDAGIGGVVSMSLYVDESGRVRKAQVTRSSGHEALDEAALKVVDTLRFTPALNGDTPVAVWYNVPITFRSN